MYKGTKNYVSETAKGFNTINWDNQFKTILKEFPNTKFYKIDDRNEWIETTGTNIQTITYETYEGE